MLEELQVSMVQINRTFLNVFPLGFPIIRIHFRGYEHFARLLFIFVFVDTFVLQVLHQNYPQNQWRRKLALEAILPAICLIILAWFIQ